MLHSDKPDVTGRWNDNVLASAMFNVDWPTHLLGFNEPDNCE